MSLSDKHEGKILVPWFCSQEWKHVYYLLYSENSNVQSKSEALQILKIWKTRQVLLSSGVEGTLIILGALLMDTTNLEEENVCLLYATSIMRFLNLCAANNRKQGTFYETARRNNLPDWLINIRHDLAHDQKVPSKFMLEYCLNYCLDWLKKEYWDAQYGIIRDFVALNKIQKKQHVEQYITLYEDIVMQVTKGGNIDKLEQLSSDSTEKLYSWFKSSNLNGNSKVSYVLLVLSKALIPSLADSAGQERFAEYLSNEIIKRGSIFEVPEEDDGSEHEKCLPANFLNLWLPVIQRLCENNILLPFLRSLLNVTLDSDLKIREIAAVWLNTIFKVLSQSTTTEGTPLGFTLNDEHCVWEHLKTFQDEVLKSPNSSTLIFIERLLLLNGCTSDYVSEVKTLINSYTQANGTTTKETVEVHTVNDLINIFSTVDIEADRANSIVSEVVSGNSSKKWCLVSDTTVFAGCPLGVLPQQKRTRNPLL